MERALDTRCPTTLTLEQLAKVLGDDPGAVLATVDAEDVPAGLHVTELTIRLGDAQTVRQQVVVQLGAPQREPDEVRWPIVWHPASHERLLPEFSGALVVRRTGSTAELALEGRYRPPLGRIGKFGDGVIGHRLARWSTATFLEEVAGRAAVAVAAAPGATGAPLRPRSAAHS